MDPQRPARSCSFQKVPVGGFALKRVAGVSSDPSINPICLSRITIRFLSPLVELSQWSHPGNWGWDLWTGTLPRNGQCPMSNVSWDFWKNRVFSNYFPTCSVVPSNQPHTEWVKLEERTQDHPVGPGHAASAGKQVGATLVCAPWKEPCWADQPLTIIAFPNPIPPELSFV